MSHVDSVYLEINGQAFELDLGGRPGERVLAEMSERVRLLGAGVGPQTVVLPLRQRQADGSTEDLMLTPEIVRDARVYADDSEAVAAGE